MKLKKMTLFFLSSLALSCSTIKENNQFELPITLPISTAYKTREKAYEKFKLAYILNENNSDRYEVFDQGNNNGRADKLAYGSSPNAESVSVDKLFSLNANAYETYQEGLKFKKMENGMKIPTIIGGLVLLDGLILLFSARVSGGPDGFNTDLLKGAYGGLLLGGTTTILGAIPQHITNKQKNEAFTNAVNIYNKWLQEFYALENNSDVE
jgi:hypothetical protein